MPRPVAGDSIARRSVKSATGADVSLPDPAKLIHLQFRRFAGCPMCNLHLQSFIRRHAELEAAGIREVVVFHSPGSELLAHIPDPPFPLIPDPDRRLYREFGVERSLRAVLDPRAWLPALRGVVRHGAALPGRGQGPLGLPADFLIASDGRVLAAKRGVHAYDHWEFAEVMRLAASLNPCPAP